MDTQMKRGAELLSNHHLEMNWVRLARWMLEILRFHQEHLAQDPVRMVFNSHLWKGSDCILRALGDLIRMVQE